MVHLRDLARTDKDLLLRWRNLPEVSRYMYTDHQITPEEHERWFARVFEDSTCHYWIVVCDNEDVGLAGITGIDIRNHRCSWAFYLANQEHRGKGIGGFVEYFILKYVFDELHLHKLCGEVFASNEKVVKMHKGFGFRVEGLFREHAWKDGRAQDVVYVAMLRSEWKCLKPGIELRLRNKGLL